MSNKKVILLIFLLSLILRIASAICLDYFFDTEKEFLDERTYHTGSSRLSRHWETRDDFDFEKEYPAWRKGYFVWDAFLYRLFGAKQIIPRLFNALLGACFVFIIYRLGLFYAGDKAAITAAFLYGVWPSGIFWSSLNLKIMWIMVFTGLSFIGFFKTLEKANIRNVLLCALPLYLLFYFQDFSALLMVFIYFTVLIFIRPLFEKFSLKRFFLFGGCFLGFLILSWYILRPHFGFINIRDFSWVSRWRNGMTLDDSAFLKGVDLSTPLKIIGFLPVSLIFFFFAPFPPFVFNVRLLMGFVENIIWYALFFVGLPVIFRLFKEDKKIFLYSAIICGYIIFLACGFSLLEGNIGSMFRHRFQILPFYFVFSAKYISAFLKGEKV